MKVLRWLCLLIILGGSVVQAEAAFVNGSFEAGNYEGWTLSETPEYWENPSTLELVNLRGYGTWGICQNGEVLEFNGALKFDFADSLYNQMYSPSLPKSCSAADGFRHSFQLQDAGQVHLMSQVLTVPLNATTISWEMMYKNHNQEAPYFRGDQRVRISFKDLNGQLIKTLFLTSDPMPLEVVDWTTYSVDISQFAGATVRFEVEVSNFQERFDAFFDNFRVEPGTTETPSEPPVVENPPLPPVVEEPGRVPPGWILKGVFPKGLQKKESLPKGFGQGKKAGW